MFRMIVFAAAGLVAGCGDGARDAPPAPQAAPGADPIAEKVWMLTDSDDLPGVMRVFLSDGVMLQNSCWETYRLSSWRRAPDGRIVWTEDGRDIAATADVDAGGVLTFRIDLGGEERVETYRRAEAPFVCPDFPR